MADLEEREMKDPNNKWLVRSGLQKAIRRGDVEEAFTCAGYLIGMDINYLRRALAIIAVEDIGIGNPKAVDQCINIYRNKKLLNEEPTQILGDLITDMCEGNKSRAFCELCFAVELKEIHDDEYPEYDVPTDEEEASDQLILDISNEDPEVSYRAVRYISKHKKTGAYQRLSQIIKYKYKDKPELVSMLLNCMAVDLEGIGYAAYTITAIVEGADDIEVEMWQSLPEEVKIKGITSAAMDMHVASGKMAIKALYTHLKKKDEYKDFITSIAQSPAKALGSIIFILEGGLISNRIHSSQLNNIKRNQDINFMKGYGVPEEHITKFMNMVESHIPTLNSKRVWANKVMSAKS